MSTLSDNTHISRFEHMPTIVRKMLSRASFAKLKSPWRPIYKFIPEIVAAFLFSTAVSLIGADLQASNIPQINLLPEFRPIGGSGNNLQNRNFDPVPGSPEIALAPLNFAPKTRNGLVDGPNPRMISNVIAGGSGANGQNAETADPVASAWLYVFGQFVDHDLDLEETLPTSASIDIVVPPGDPVFGQGTSISMTRATRSPRTNTILNTVAGYLDLSQLYGSTPEIASSLRNADGTLKASDNGQALPVVNDVFVTGDPRVMENPELTAVTILFMREHNFWVGTLKAQHPDWGGDQLYNMAKAVTTAEYQNIVYNEYLPLLIGPVLEPYRGYVPTVNAQVTQEFSTAAFRVGHSQISDTQEGIDNKGNEVFSQSLADAFFNTPEEDEANGIDPLLRNLGTDFAQATDVYAVGVLRNLLFAPLVGGEVDEIDLIAIDIQRERDAGLGTLDQTRQAIGLQPYNTFADLTPDPVLQKNLQSVYGTVDKVDLFMGGLAESHAKGAVVGTTFQAIIAHQFRALRAGDRFFWQNEGFNSQTALMISNTTLADIMRRNTNTPNLQINVFITAPLPKRVKPHVVLHSVIDTHGQRVHPFIGDGV
jgi:peroxidase